MSDDQDKNTTVRLERQLIEFQRGNPEALEGMIEVAWEKLLRLTRTMLRRFPQLRRFEDSNDVFQLAMGRFWEALRRLTPHHLREFFGLAALQIRRTLVDLCRHYFGPEGAGTNEQRAGGWPRGQEPADPNTSTGDLIIWEEFHEQIGALPDELREVFELTWYYELKREEVAQLLDLPVRTVQIRWREARVKVYEGMEGRLPSA
jgi:RNA polymerase sigma-70 factor (ECF subfamily)